MQKGEEMSNDLTSIKQRNDCEHCKYSKDMKEYFLCTAFETENYYSFNTVNCRCFTPKNPKRKKAKK